MAIAWVLRDRIRRIVTAEFEVQRKALRLIVKDQRNPLPVRVRAQIELQKLPRMSHPSAITNRCIVGGKTRGHIGEFKMSQIEFRNHALCGELPGVKKALW
ncbi:40S ribosomal protein mrp2, mitochondrial [Polyrhizophydium stewartii]|uniref:40S ribosomal protein mrp2, mitochondrial n=1 Tax=Polyrhizophydium stewartii TaxID=2732419 RepID=A0ABR4NFQ1_9FUNG|nr:40S ribosomal protein mrp2, mitochondrial [Polyrhizophydium stewartii]